MSLEEEKIPWHPRKEPKIPGVLTRGRVREVFSGCVDFFETELFLAGDREKSVTMFYILGMVRNERANDYIMRPLSSNEKLGSMPLDEAVDWMSKGALTTMSVKPQESLDGAVNDLITGNVLLFFGNGKVLSCAVPSEEKRSISPPENEPVIKGARDSFVEYVRTNTSTLRRRLRTPDLKISEVIVGRQTLTAIDIVYIEGLTDPELVAEVKERAERIDVDAMLDAGSFEEYMSATVKSPFPQMAYTERPDRFCQAVVEGRVGILVDGLPLGFVAPATMGYFFRANEDRAKNWMEASFLRCLRYLCMMVALLLPAFYVAVVSFHPEMLPAPLAWSIVAAKLDVPFSTIVEVLILLLSFEIVQEAGLRLPPAIGTTVSILGGLVVGSAAVEAKIVSPAVLIVVASAGIAGYTMPSQDFSGALRLWRLALVIGAGIGGLFGVLVVAVLLIQHLARLESFGAPFLSPFAATLGEDSGGILRLPVSWVKLRDRTLKTVNRRNQK